MYLWKTKGLANAMKEDSLDEKELFKYFFVYFFGLTAIVESMNYAGPIATTNLNISGSGIMIAITGISLYLCFKVNSSGDNQKFIERYICLSIPLSIKLVLLIMVLAISYVVGEMLLGEGNMEIDENPSPYEHLIASAFTVFIFYWRMYVHLKFIAHKANNPELES